MSKILSSVGSYWKEILFHYVEKAPISFPPNPTKEFESPTHCLTKALVDDSIFYRF